MEAIRAERHTAPLLNALSSERDAWRALALEALADLRELRKALLPDAGVESEPGVVPKTTREVDAARARALREAEQEEVGA